MKKMQKTRMRKLRTKVRYDLWRPYRESESYMNRRARWVLEIVQDSIPNTF